MAPNPSSIQPQPGWSRRALLAGGLAAGLGLVGCSGRGSSSGLRDAAVVCWTQAWDTFDQVRADTTVAVVATAVSQARVSGVENPDGPQDTTLTTMTVAQSFGAQLGEVQVRSSDGFDANDVAHYQVGQTYLIFLTPHYWQAEQPTGQHAAVGELAAYRLSGNRARRLTKRDGLPRKLSRDDLLAQAQQVR